MLPATVVLPRVGSFALALFGKVRKAQPPLAGLAGRKSLAVKRIVEAVLFTLRVYFAAVLCFDLSAVRF